MNVKELLCKDGWVNEVNCLINKVFVNKGGSTSGYIADKGKDAPSIKFFSKKDLSEYEGKFVKIHGKGLMRKDNEYNGTVTPQLVIGQNASIDELTSQQVDSSPATKTAQAGGGYSYSKSGVELKPDELSKKNFDHLCKFYAECFKTAVNMSQDLDDYIGMAGVETKDFVTNVVNSLFATRNNNAVYYSNNKSVSNSKSDSNKDTPEEVSWEEDNDEVDPF